MGVDIESSRTPIPHGDSGIEFRPRSLRRAQDNCGSQGCEEWYEVSHFADWLSCSEIGSVRKVGGDRTFRRSLPALSGLSSQSAKALCVKYPPLAVRGIPSASTPAFYVKALPPNSSNGVLHDCYHCRRQRWIAAMPKQRTANPLKLPADNTSALRSAQRSAQKSKPHCTHSRLSYRSKTKSLYLAKK